MIIGRDVLKAAASLAIVSPASGPAMAAAPAQSATPPMPNTLPAPRVTGLTPAEQLAMEDLNTRVSVEWARKNLQM
ncbi:MAG: hypothetical protein ABIW19_15585 [Vicinamibacterales bacterium]